VRDRWSADRNRRRSVQRCAGYAEDMPLSIRATVRHAYGRALMVGRSRLVEGKRAQELVGNLLEASDADGRDWVEAFLQWSAQLLKADKAWLLVGSRAELCRTWSSTGHLLPAEAETLTQTAATRFAWRDDRIFVAPNWRTDVVDDRLRPHRASFRAAMVLLRFTSRGETAIVGLSGRNALRIMPEATDTILSVLDEVLQLLRQHQIDHWKWMHGQDKTTERRMETIGIFASGMAHNLNNVIAAIAGFNAITERHVAPDSVAGRSAIDINVSVRRAQEIVSEVLSFGRRLERPSTIVDVGDLLAETATMLAVSLPRRIKIERDGSSRKCQVTGNFGQLQQVLLNICNNAAHAMAAGGTIRFECRRIVLSAERNTRLGVLDPGAYVTVSVIDSGIGMSSTTAARIFDPFFTARAGGSGLGLSTARDIIEQHGGGIDVQSQPGKGTTFMLWLAAAPPHFIAASDAALTGSSKVVLIINADADRLMIDEELVAELGYEPLAICDISMIEDMKSKADAVLIAGIDGDTVAAALDMVRRAGLSLPILVAAAATAAIAPAPSLGYPLGRRELADALSKIVFQNLEQARASVDVSTNGAIAAGAPALPGVLASGPTRRSPLVAQAMFEGRWWTEFAERAKTLNRRSARTFDVHPRFATLLRSVATGQALLPLSVGIFSVWLTISFSPSLSVWQLGNRSSAWMPPRGAISSGAIKQKLRAENGASRIPGNPARRPLLTDSFSQTGGEHAVATSDKRRPDQSRRNAARIAANTRGLAASGHSRSPPGGFFTDRTSPQAALQSVRFFSSVYAVKPTICRRYVATRWMTIGTVRASDCLRLNFAKENTSYVQVGDLVLSRRDGRVFRINNGLLQRLELLATKTVESSGVSITHHAVLSTTNSVVCRRYDGAKWRKLGTMTTHDCAERGFAVPGTGYVQAGLLSLSRHGDWIGVLRGVGWRSLAKISNDQYAQSSVTLHRT
jgi:signal transduction histidine kinase